MARSGRLAVLLSVAFTAFTLTAAPLSAGTLHVPGDSPTIQGAIVLAANGDTILVAPGTYVETIDFSGKQLVIEGTGGAAVTTIDADGGPTAVTADGAEPAGTALRGFTLTGGTGRDVIVVDSSLGDYHIVTGGGGLYAGPGAHLDLSDCVITGNTIPTATFSYGGGVLAYFCTLQITDCSFSNNSAEDAGAALATANGTVTLTMNGCTVTNNTSPGGPAILILDGHGEVNDCVIADNTGTGLGKTGYGVAVTHCTFYGNTEYGYSMFAWLGSDVIDLTFLGNGLGGAVCSDTPIGQGNDVVRGCVFAGGDSLRVSGTPYSTIDNCTFDGAAILNGNKEVYMRNCIVRGAGSIESIGYVDAIYSDIQGPIPPGIGIIDSDPLWVNAAAQDYALLPASPCIDTGDPTSPLDPDGTRADMGAISFENAFDNLAGGVAGSAGVVALAAHSTLLGGEGVYFKLTGTPPLQPVVLILGATQLGAPFKSGTLWPNPSVLINLLTNGAGQLTLSTTWPAAIPTGFSLWAQFWHPDAGAVAGFAGSNGVRGTVP